MDSRIRIVTAEVGNARQMALAADGTLFVGSWTEGKVYAVPKALTSERPETIVLAEKLALPSGVTVRNATSMSPPSTASCISRRSGSGWRPAPHTG